MRRWILGPLLVLNVAACSSFDAAEPTPADAGASCVSASVKSSTGASFQLAEGGEWSNPDGAIEADGVFASTNTLGKDVRSRYLGLVALGLSIPEGASVQGIAVTVVRGSAGGGVVDESVRLVRANDPAGDDRKNILPWPPSPAPIDYGSPTDLWGVDWTREDVVSPGFGVAVAARNDANSGESARIDGIRLTVYYCP
ncbi:MAG: hypothetical protein KIT84_37260 [Labilithrix sp.]|nr:hypothetical protein [Labilithrix sp.]MCW5816708.1 hypothetical protein [Labilithrix sp.]